jgi:hypothetical protein
LKGRIRNRWRRRSLNSQSILLFSTKRNNNKILLTARGIGAGRSGGRAAY